MDFAFKVKNVVLVGNFLTNVPTFDKYFFIKNNIVAENEILAGSIFDPIGGVQLVTSKFTMVLNAAQLIITAAKPELNEDKIESIISSLIKAGSINTTQALGINFHWFLSDNKTSIETLSRSLFYNDKVELFNKNFNTGDSMFGAYASKNFKDSRLKLDIKPSKLTEAIGGKSQDIINFSFNFHFDIKDKTNGEEVLKHLADFDSYKRESENIIAAYK